MSVSLSCLTTLVVRVYVNASEWLVQHERQLEHSRLAEERRIELEKRRQFQEDQQRFAEQQNAAAQAIEHQRQLVHKEAQVTGSLHTQKLLSERSAATLRHMCNRLLSGSIATLRHIERLAQQPLYDTYTEAQLCVCVSLSLSQPSLSVLSSMYITFKFAGSPT